VKSIDIASIAGFADGTLVCGNGARLVTEVNTDSRRISPGEVFVALVGERFDAHAFIPNVIAAGAAAVIVSRVDESWKTPACAIILVRDTLTALQQLASRYRDWHDPLIIGITGSNGKTSTKDLTSAVMSAGRQVRATPGNLNNHIGVPLTLLTLQAGDTCGVIEMGMNHPGEIAPLAAIAKPDGAIITNIGVAHIEHMGSREAIALEKGMLAEAVAAEGFVILNANDEFTPSIRQRTQAKVVEAGIGRGDVSAHDLRGSTDGTHFTLDFGGTRHATFLPVPGEHMVGNAALAAAAAWQAGVAPEQIVAALSASRLTKEPKEINGVTFLDDSYNANPDSMRAGLRTLAGLQCEGRRVAVLGRMGELGPHAESGHREVGSAAAQAGIDALLTVGDEARWIAEAAAAAGLAHVETFDHHEQAAENLRTWLKAGDLVLVKGSRSAAMEKVITLYSAA
jgi:UDP-N-acetylmuramoyl-tripeptide--D-alanyl-D-alanine ligase